MITKMFDFQFDIGLMRYELNLSGSPSRVLRYFFHHAAYRIGWAGASEFRDRRTVYIVKQEGRLRNPVTGIFLPLFWSSERVLPSFS